MDILATQEKIVNGLTFKLDLVGYPEEGMSSFNDKWRLDENGLINGNDSKYTCTWFTIGKLKDGFDVTQASAQKEFNRDCNAFDVSLRVTTLKNGIEILNQHIVSSDFNYSECEKELLNDLMENLDYEYLHGESLVKIKSLVEELTK